MKPEEAETKENVCAPIREETFLICGKQKTFPPPMTSFNAVAMQQQHQHQQTTQAAEDKSHSNSSSPHSQIMRTGSSQLKSLFDGLSHLYAAPTEPRKRGLYGFPPIYSPQKRPRKTPVEKVSPNGSNNKKGGSLKSRGGLSASASKIVKKARAAMGSKKTRSVGATVASVQRQIAVKKKSSKSGTSTPTDSVTSSKPSTSTKKSSKPPSGKRVCYLHDVYFFPQPYPSIISPIVPTLSAITTSCLSRFRACLLVVCSFPRCLS